MDDRVRGAAYSRGSFGGPRGSSGNGPQSYNRDGPPRRDYKSDRGDFKNDRSDRDYDRNARSDRGYFQGGCGPERERDDSRRPNPNSRRRDDRRRVTDDDDTVMDSQEASSVDRESVSSMDGAGRPRRRRKRGAFSGNVGAREARDGPSSGLNDTSGPNGPNGPQSADPKVADVAPGSSVSSSKGGNQSVTSTNGAGAPIPSVNIEASSSALTGDLNSNPKPPREQKGRGPRPPPSKRGGGNPGSSSAGNSGSIGSGVALPDTKQDKTLVNGTSA